MATDSFGQTVHLTNEMADRIIETMECDKAAPPKPHNNKINWGDPDKIAAAWRKEYENEK
jgi:hypothetical protein